MDDTRLHTLDRATSLILIILAVLQGYALYALHLAVDHEHWLATDLRWLKSLYTIAIALPAFYLISMVRLRERINLLPLLLAPLLFWMGWHLGSIEQRPEPLPHSSDPFTPSFCIAVGMALFILALFFRSCAASGRWTSDYQPLLAYSWEHALTIAQVGLFVAVFWGLLWLWAALFAAIGLGFFRSLFTEAAFIYPVTWLVIGLGLVMIRNRFRFLVNVRLMCEALIKALLPLVALIILMFFAVLPWTGLQPVWDTGKAAQMLMALMLTMLFFFNAVFYQTKEQPPYPAWLRALVLLTVVLLPIGSLLAAWGLWLRIDQYGLSLDRLWGAVLQALTAAFTLTYSALLLWRRHNALSALQRANVWLGLLVAVVLILINTPLADMRRWAAESQVNRLIAGRTALDEFDYKYVRFRLGQPGEVALRQLVESSYAQAHPELKERIERVLKQKREWNPDPLIDTHNLAEVAKQFEVSPAHARLPDSLLAVLVEQKSHCLREIEPCRVVRIENDPVFEWLVPEQYGSLSQAYAAHADGWYEVGLLNVEGGLLAKDDPACGKAQPEADLRRVPGTFAIYRSGDCLYELSPSVEASRKQAAAASDVHGLEARSRSPGQPIQ